MGARKKKPVSSVDVNAYIKKHAASASTWDVLARELNRALGVQLTRDAVRMRGRSLGVKTQARRIESAGLRLPGDPLEARLGALLKRRKSLQTVEALADELDVAPARVRGAMERLKDAGHNVVVIAGNVELSPDLPKRSALRINIAKLQGEMFRFGVTGDNHLGSRYERLDVLNALFDTWASQGIQTVYQLGNMIDGEARFNKTDLLAYGMDGQARYFAKHWPQRPGMTTHFITGDDHEGWYVQREGVDIGRYLENVAREMGRKDLVYLGHMEHDISFEGRKQKSIMRLIHAGGGSSYATSYAAQKIVESYQGGEKPAVLLVGHYHKAEYGYPREVHVLQCGCTCDQTPFMRKKKLQAHVGGWTVEMTVNPDGLITRFRSEWMPFYDLGFYEKAWRYRAAA
jgi:hypothetical protein